MKFVPFFPFNNYSINSYVMLVKNYPTGRLIESFLFLRCSLVNFMGYLSCIGIADLPATIKHLSLGIKNSYDATAVANLPKHFRLTILGNKPTLYLKCDQMCTCFF